MLRLCSFAAGCGPGEDQHLELLRPVISQPSGLASSPWCNDICPFPASTSSIACGVVLWPAKY